MNSDLKTKVDEKLFKTRATITKRLTTGEHYTYLIKAKGTSYLLKGYTICLEHLKPGDLSTKTRFMEALSHIGEAYQEYFFYKIASIFNLHFIKALGFDYDIQLAQEELSFSYVHFEIIFEFSGELLSEIPDLSFTTIYNLMRQSANALSILHNTNVLPYDIKPSNLLYDKSKNLLGVLNMGNNNDTLEFTAPEILLADSKKDTSNLRSVIPYADVYSWGMTFYSLVLSKNQCDLINEAKRYKLGTEDDHMKFLAVVASGLKKIKLKDEEEKMMGVVEKELLKALNYRAEKRPSINEIIAEFKKFEKEEKIKIAYSNIEQQNRSRLIELLAIEDEEAKEYYKNLRKWKDEVKIHKEITGRECKYCESGKNVKAELNCNHYMCADCLIKYIEDKFTKKEYYNYRVTCNICKKTSKLGIPLIQT